MSGSQEFSSEQRTALEMLAEHNGKWSKAVGWYAGNPTKTARLFESLRPTGLVVRTSPGCYAMTAEGFSAMEDHLNSLPVDEF